MDFDRNSLRSFNSLGFSLGSPATIAVASFSLLGVLLASEPAHAGGILIYEAGQEGAGLANAGAAVLATDPSIMMNNPAGISQLKGTQVNANAQVILGAMTFSRDGGNTTAGGNGGNPLEYLPSTSLFISHELNEKASIGFGVYGNFGLTADYDDDWAGRYFSQEATLLGLSFQPTFAYKITDDLSVGIGPRFVYGYFRTEVAVNNSPFDLLDLPDGQLRYKDEDWGTGVNVGVLYRLNERTQLGLAYTSKVKFEFSDAPELKHISNPVLNVALQGLNKLDLDMNIPQTATASLSYDLSPQWKLLGSVGWQDWSDFGKIGVEVDTDASGTSSSADRHYKDTWHVSVGAQNQINKRLRWNMGLGYDSSAVDDADRTVDLPMGDTWRLATGLNYALEENLDFHLAYTLVWMGDMPIEQTKRASGQTVSGEYRNAALHILGGGMVWRF